MHNQSFFRKMKPGNQGILLMLFAGFLFFLSCNNHVSGQPGNPAFNMLKGANDSSLNPATPLDLLFYPKYGQKHPDPVIKVRSGQPFSPATADTYFYILCGLLLFVGISLRAFPKYYSDLYRVFIRSGFRQKSIRDQLVQNKLASLGLNMIFFITGGIFIYLISKYEMVIPLKNWYFQVLVCIGFLFGVYLVKFLSLKAGGWVFSAGELVDNYAFLVFFVNKIAGLFLIPVVILLWLGSSIVHPVIMVISFIVITLLFLYRYFLILPMVRNKSGVSSFHFFLYLCTFEILPILLLVKFLVNFLNTSN